MQREKNRENTPNKIRYPEFEMPCVKAIITRSSQTKIQPETEKERKN